ncbi:MAG: efflux RND transporter periplasmic adaptor subunit [Bacteroidota bacterium]
MKSKLISIVALALIFNQGCKQKEETVSAKFCLTPEMEKSITIDTAKTAMVENELKLTGKVTYNEENVLKIFPQVSGVVKEVKVGIGDHVQKGQVLAIIRSSEMATIENDLNNAQSNYEISKKNFNAIEDMYKGGISSEKEYITAKKEMEKALSELNKSKNISGVFGNSNSSDYYIKAPLSGVIVEKHINPNMQIRTDFSDNLFVISDLKNVWVMANVFESDISKVQEGYEAIVTTLSYPDDIIKGKVDKVYSVLDPVAKVMKARIKLENSNYLLKPEMFAYVTINYAENNSKLAIPSKAVIFDNSKYYVLVYKDKSNIEPREINIYKSIREKTYIDSGLKPGERVITNNNLLIYDEITNQ